MSTDIDQRVKTYMTVFKHANLQVDWKAFASELGISTVSNAQRKFRDMLKKDGFQYNAGKVTPLDNTNAPASQPTAPKRKKATPSEANTRAKKTKKASLMVGDNENGNFAGSDGAESV